MTPGMKTVVLCPSGVLVLVVQERLPLLIPVLVQW